jgi:hypothetical protein
VNVTNWVEPEEVCTLLNAPSLAEADFRAAEDHIEHAYRRHLPAEEILSGDEWAPHRAAMCGSTLRGLVDEWLRTGVDQRGVEHPATRSLMATSDARHQIERYLRHHPLTVSFSAESAHFSLDLGDPAAIPEFTLNPSYDLELEACRLFTGLIASDWKERLCKCRYQICGRYFVMDRVPHKRYVKGTFCCRRHQSSAMAAPLTAAKRRTQTEKLIAIAAAYLRGRRADWNGNALLVRKLLDHINAHMADHPDLRLGRQYIAVNWITRHKTEIERKRAEDGRR